MKLQEALFAIVSYPQMQSWRIITKPVQAEENGNDPANMVFNHKNHGYVGKGEGRLIHIKYTGYWRCSIEGTFPSYRNFTFPLENRPNIGGFSLSFGAKIIGKNVYHNYVKKYLTVYEWGLKDKQLFIEREGRSYNLLHPIASMFQTEVDFDNFAVHAELTEGDMAITSTDGATMSITLTDIPPDLAFQVARLARRNRIK